MRSSPRDKVDDFVALAEAFFAEYASDYTESAACCGIITKRHFDRLHLMLDDAKAAGARLVSLGGSANAETRQMPLTLVIDAPTEAKIMLEEIFGPILPIIPYDTIDDAIAHINAGEKAARPIRLCPRRRRR